MSTLVHHAPITIIVIICVTLSLTNGQLVLQQDGLTNSYSVATPSFQTSFTRIFGGGQPAAQPLQQQPQPQQQYFPQRQFLGQSQFQQLQQVQPAAALNDQVLSINFNSIIFSITHLVTSLNFYFLISLSFHTRVQKRKKNYTNDT